MTAAVYMNAAAIQPSIDAMTRGRKPTGHYRAPKSSRAQYLELLVQALDSAGLSPQRLPAALVQESYLLTYTHQQHTSTGEKVLVPLSF